MAKAINGKRIDSVCTIHGMQYGKSGIPNPQSETESGLCDICEAVNNPSGLQELSAPQTIRSVDAYNGLRLISPLVNYEEPKI